MKTNKDTISFRHKIIDIYKISNGCEICGYNKHPSALCFDHLPEFEKTEITKNGCSKRTCAGGMYRLYTRHISIDDLIAEIKKCRVMCSNCHMELTHHKNTRTYSKETKLSLDVLQNKLVEFENEQSIL
jgi:hypothetical protein